jgi:nucleoside-diphosphate-sugar epimerase
MDEEFDLIHVDDVADALTGLVFAPRLDFLTYNSGGEFATVSSIAQTLEKIRPDVTVECSSPPATLAHCSRIDWRRLHDLLGDDRLSLNTRMSAMANNE